VTDQLLQNPAPGDWLTWRRTLDGQGYSPLTQITRENVSEIKLAWVVAMREGSNQAAPIVHDGVMYLLHPGNVVQALDAATGEVIWEYAYPHPTNSLRVNGAVRALALYGDSIIFGTSDAALVALDARTGYPRWRSYQADYRQGFSHTGGPIVANGVVVIGINGCERFKREGCFITGHDAATGRERWRTSTIALPGDRNDASWGKLPPEFRGGGDAWIPGSFDPSLKLFFVGTAQAKPWMAVSRGMSAKQEALYTNSTLALDPMTGKIVWHFQHVPGESLDMDVAFERVLVDIGPQKTLFTAGKDGILWKLDRKTGKYLDLVPTVFQNVYDTIDRVEGRVRYRADILEMQFGKFVAYCPSHLGGHNWQAMAYSPETAAVILPLHQLCGEMAPRKIDFVIGGGSWAGDTRIREMPGKERQLGKLASYDVKTMKEMWSIEQHASFTTGALTTAGGLVFIGDVDRRFSARDARTGQELWNTRLGAGAHGFPITYTAGGKQYVSVQTGMGVFRSMTASLAPDIYQPSNGSAIYAFELRGSR
jgi:alcohol dehydrogenase (cytochrome c)